MGPVSPTTAFDIGEKTKNPTDMYLSDIFTLPLNLSGRPGMSIPIGFDTQKRPIGLQVVGNFWDEQRLLNFTHQFQVRTQWHLESPELQS